MNVSLNNAVPVLLALALVLKFISAETSAPSSTTSAISSTTTTASTTTRPTNPTSAASTTSKTGEAPSARPVTEKWEELEGCFEKRQCDNVTCEECSPEDVHCAWWCKQICRCSCSVYKIVKDPTVPDLSTGMCLLKGSCSSEPDQCLSRCSGDQKCQHECELKHLECRCACLQSAASAKDSVAITTTTATSCSRSDKMTAEWVVCSIKKCHMDFDTECVDGGDGECRARENRKKDNCLCACGGRPSATDYDHLDESDECVKEVRRNGETCRRIYGGQNRFWCEEFEFPRRCACLAVGAAGSSGAAGYRMGTKDRNQLERCATAWECLHQTCGCPERDKACLSRCIESCRCNKCLSFPADGPGVPPAGGGWTVSQCRERYYACATICGGDTNCIDTCDVDRQVCNCICAGRSSPPRPTPTVTNPPDTGDKEIVMHCNYLS